MTEVKTNPVQRVLSIDIFRGLTIALMILANVSTKMDLPWWMEHAAHTKSRENMLTWVDVIFPAFMFIMGLSIPLGLSKLLSKGVTMIRLSGHIIFRGLILIWVGGLLYGMGNSPEKIGFSLAAWVTMGFFAMAAMLIDWRGKLGGIFDKGSMYRIVPFLGAAYFIWATARLSELNVSILGELGAAYIVAGFIWLGTRENHFARLTAYGLLFLLACHLQTHEAFLRWSFKWYLFVPKVSILVLAGTFIGDFFLPGKASPENYSRLKKYLLVYGLAFIAAAAFVNPDFFHTFKGIRKTLFCTGLCMWFFCLLWQLECVLGGRRFFKAAIKPLLVAGRNPLFAYALQFSLAGGLALIVSDRSWIDMVTGYVIFGGHGWTGFLCIAIPYTAVVIVLTGLANRFSLYMKL